jgi:hypothetical protein
MTMPIRIRRADLSDDRQGLIDLFSRHLTRHSDERRFDWLYSSSPHGPAQAWLACNGDNAIVGAAAAFPRRFYLDGREVRGLVLGDFCMEVEHRSLGPALQLQRACVAGIQSGAPFEFFYDFPSDKMMAIYKRMQIPAEVNVIRWAKPLRVDGRLRLAGRSRRVARGLSIVANAVLSRRGWSGRKDSCEIALHEGKCTAEFTALDQALGARKGLSTVRTAEYLNWRFLDHPVTRHRIIVARRYGRLLGYGVISCNPTDANIVDINSVEDPSVIARLLAGAVAQLRDVGASTVSLSAIESHPWSPIFERSGFRRREKAPFIFSAISGTSIPAAAFQQGWFLMRGERDS